MLHKVFPPRNLGLSEPWGREVESFIDQTRDSLQDFNQVLDNLGKTKAAQQGVFSRLLSDLRGASNRLADTNEVLSGRFSSDRFQSNIRPLVLGTQISLEAPEWASAGIVFSSLSAVSNPGTGWVARVDLLAEPEPISSYVTGSRVVAAGGMGFEPIPGLTPPTVLMYETFPQARFLDDFNRELFIRPIGVQVGGGSTSVTHVIEVEVSVLWVGAK